MLQGEKLLANRDEPLASNLRLFLLNCIGLHDKLVFKTEAETGQNPDSEIPKFPRSEYKLVLTHKTYIFEGWGLETVMTAK